MDNFDLRKYLAEGRLLKENMSLDIMDDGFAELEANSGNYVGEIEDGKISFSVMYEDEDDRDGMEFDEDNWKDILGPNHAFVEIASKIPTEVEALDDYVMITVDFEDLKGITTTNQAEGRLLKEDTTPSREEIFNDFEQMVKDLADKTGAKIDSVEWEKQFRFVTRDLPYFGWWGGAMHDIVIEKANPTEEEAKQAYDSAKEFVDTFTEKYLDYKSFVDKGKQAFKDEVERRRKEIQGGAFKPMKDDEWPFDHNPYYSDFFSKP